MPNKVLKALTFAFDYYSNRYECFEAKGKEIETCLEIRRKVFGEELKRTHKGKGLGGPGTSDKFDADSMHIACRDMRSGEIVGAVRLTHAKFIRGHADHEREYLLESFAPGFVDRVVVAARMAVLPEHRQRGVVGLQLAMKCYEINFEKYLFACAVCEPGIYPMYRRLGYRPLGRVQNSPFGGYRLPLYLNVHDYESLEKCHSPFAKIAKKLPPVSRTAWQGWESDFQLEHGPIDPGFSPLDVGLVTDYHSPLSQGVSKAGLKELLQNALKIQCKFGEKVIAEADGGQNIGFVLRGALEVQRQKKVMVVLGEGDVFGELAFVLALPRSADVYSVAENTEVAFLSLSSFKRVTRPKDRETVWKNLASILARRIYQLPVS